MLSTILRKRAQALALILVLSVLLTTMAALAATQLIKADKGGRIKIANGVLFKVSPNALKADTVITAEMKITDDYVDFYFGPDGTVFAEPAELKVSWKFIEKNGVDDLTLYGEKGEEIHPSMDKKALVYPIRHFSLFYYRRR